MRPVVALQKITAGTRMIRRVSALTGRMPGNRVHQQASHLASRPVANGAGVATPRGPKGAPPAKRGLPSGRSVTAFEIRFLGELLPGLRHLLQNLAVPLGLGLARHPAALLGK